ncbi:MAG: translation elongation factor-like protein [Methanobacteriota archaeon]|nr:MAG: translation elongation factor-like protein [Euryarchaeota archaeon]
MGEKEKIGEVFTYFSKIGVAGIRLTEGGLRLGDTISIEGHTTNFTQTVDSMQMDHGPVEEASAGDEVGIKVVDKVRKNDVVYKVL